MTSEMVTIQLTNKEYYTLRSILEDANACYQMSGEPILAEDKALIDKLTSTTSHVYDYASPFSHHEILVGDNPTPFTGNYRYRPDMQTKNWHYYEREDGKMLHIPKSCIGPVLGDTAENILKNRRSIPEGV